MRTKKQSEIARVKTCNHNLFSIHIRTDCEDVKNSLERTGCRKQPVFLCNFLKRTNRSVNKMVTQCWKLERDLFCNSCTNKIIKREVQQKIKRAYGTSGLFLNKVLSALFGLA